MKKQYTKPEISFEDLFSEDVLKLSTDTENNYVNSKNVLPENFNLESIL